MRHTPATLKRGLVGADTFIWPLVGLAVDVSASVSGASSGGFLHTFADDFTEKLCKSTRFVFVRLVILP